MWCSRQVDIVGIELKMVPLSCAKFLRVFLSLSQTPQVLSSRNGAREMRATCRAEKNEPKNLKHEVNEHQFGIRVQTEMTFANDFSLHTHMYISISRLLSQYKFA